MGLRSNWRAKIEGAKLWGALYVLQPILVVVATGILLAHHCGH